MDELKDKIIVIVGPTCSGKSKLAQTLAGMLDGEIINADTRAFYRGLDIGVAKPDIKMQIKYCYQLIDIANPNETISLHDFLKLAKRKIKEINKRGKIPIVEGGSMLFINALIYNYKIPKVSADAKLRQNLEKKTTSQLYLKLKKIDPKSAMHIDKHNKRRLIRALEVKIKTGKSFYGIRKKKKLSKNILLFGIDMNNKLLESRVKSRTKKIFGSKFKSEVKKLSKEYGFDNPAFSAIGYREMKSVIDKKITLKEGRDLVNKNTMKLVKRQKTWLRSNNDIVWI